MCFWTAEPFGYSQDSQKARLCWMHNICTHSFKYVTLLAASYVTQMMPTVTHSLQDGRGLNSN